ncbi:YafY family protein [Pedobacter sp. KR3-3]|uniref:YafY family protein n=1 Tax=Pedobacter albus TaxID=3113905 RepID=A0ABU7I377_9SPHI|nr:YafY family protein [Pedobacter sp. KR3-3]MEE1943821.1 YafY family protein [Pedobacter sp. KR3-3]
MSNNPKRLPRLTAILTQLQTKRLLTATELAEKFEVSIRTIYRDIRALEQSGVPILTDPGKGYSIMEGYRVPPIMLTESEANALVTAEQLIRQNKDSSFVREYIEAINKIKSVLRYNTKDKANLLAERTIFAHHDESNHTSSYLSCIQLALTNFKLIRLNYLTLEGKQTTQRVIEPFAIYNSTQENWLLIAWCRLRKDYRAFRMDRMTNLEVLQEAFEPHQLTLEEYIEICKKNYEAALT